MTARDLTIDMVVAQSPQDVFNAINNVVGWWSADFNGSSHQLGDEFEVRFGDVHYSRQRLVEVVPGEKVVWLVTDSHLSFLDDKSEWTGTTIRFELSTPDTNTHLHFTHVGLVPDIECFGDCSNGWNQYLLHSLLPLITTGLGYPNVLIEEIEKKAAQ
jgi:uncharacterized protein YndB with AHSA1/START domain